MCKKDKCCNNGYQNLANVVSYVNFPSVTGTEEAAPLSYTDSTDWAISNDGLSLICKNYGIWSVNAIYELQAVADGFGLMKGFFRVNDIDLQDTKKDTTILTIDQQYKQKTILCIAMVKYFNKGDRLSIMAKAKNKTSSEDKTSSDILNIQAFSGNENPSLIIAMKK